MSSARGFRLAPSSVNRKTRYPAEKKTATIKILSGFKTNNEARKFKLDPLSATRLQQDDGWVLDNACRLPVNYVSGSAPNRFCPLVPCWTNQKTRIMNPITGINEISSHHPDLSRSCRRRTPTPIAGKTIASPQIVLKMP